MTNATPQTISDTAVRAEVIDPTRSFIVQAPAGSGKTSLLVQRYLSLLATVEEPEEILAITFTKKAAEEMRERVIEMLTKALQEPEPDPSNEYKHNNWLLARRVLERDREQGWDLLLAKKRLRLRTIDSFCRYITSSLPSSSRLGGGLDPSDNSDVLYECAISTMIQAIDNLATTEPDNPAVIAYRSLLRMCGNDKAKLTFNLCSSLEQRSLWLELSRQYLLPLNSPDQRATAEQELNKMLTRAVREHYAPKLNGFHETLVQGDSSGAMLLKVMRFAKDNLTNDNKQQDKLCQSLETGLKNYHEEQWPAFHKRTPLTNLDLYRSAYKMVSDSEGRIRKTESRSLNARQGLRDNNDERKKWFKSFLDANRDSLQKDIEPLKSLCESELGNDNGQADAYKYSPDQITLLQHTSFLLEIANNFLQQEFRRQHCCDFSEIAIRAQDALGTLESPSALAQQLDSKIKHILVDEYQDTSKAQLDLLEKLTADWSPGDGRTIFMVGDPMQSIYRFRQAEVGIYLRTRDVGLSNGVKPEAKQLTTNFRSVPSLISWFNTSFKSEVSKARLFPVQDSLTTGAIAYATAESKDSEGGDDPVFHFEDHKDNSAEREQDEASLIIDDIIEPERQAHPGESLAILVQKRKQANGIISLLRQKGIPYQAIDIEELQSTPIVNLLSALTKALLDINDRLAWLTLLRSPWVGLNDKEITMLVESLASNASATSTQTVADARKTNVTIWELLTHLDKEPMTAPDASQSSATLQSASVPEIVPLPNLAASSLETSSPQAAERCRRFLKIMRQALNQRGQQALDTWVQGTWLALGGPRALTQPYEYDLANEYFAFLKEQNQQDIPDAFELDRRLEGRYAAPHAYSAQDNPVKIMTMHGAKGLEFDCVILPFLEARPNDNADGLLQLCYVYPDQTTSIPVFHIQANNLPDEDEDEDEDEDDELLDRLQEETSGQASVGNDSQTSNTLFREIVKACADNERKRLFYVAATRAKKRLHLVAFKGKGNSACMMQDIVKAELHPDPSTKASANAEAQPTPESLAIEDVPLRPIIRLHDQAFQNLTPAAVIPLQTRPVYADSEQLSYGSALHNILETLLCEDIDRHDSAALNALVEDCCLATENSSPTEKKHICRSRAHADLQVMLTSAIGQWALADYAESSCEQDVLVKTKRYPKLYRLDRIFFDVNGKFWIIDYKTGHDEGKTDPQEYHEIMETYAKTMANIRNLAEVNLALIYVNAERRAEYGGPIFRELGLYKSAENITIWSPPGQ